MKGDIERLQKEWRANAQEREILKKIGKAGEVQDKPALSKFLSEINDEAQRGSNVGISVKLLSESVRSVVDQAEDDSAVGPSARYLTTQDKERYTRIIVGTVAGFAAGTAASGGNPVGGVIGGIGVGLVTAWANPK